MLLTKPDILYDTIVQYEIEPNIALKKYLKIKWSPEYAIVKSGKNVSIAKTPPNLKNTSILWQHLFLADKLKSMTKGWHLCLLPRQMVVVIKDGLYVCERLLPNNEEPIESTKKYLYRFDYTPDIPMNVYDFQDIPETVRISKNYKGFIFKTNEKITTKIYKIISTALNLLKPHLLILLASTCINLLAATCYYSLYNYRHDYYRIELLKQWPTLKQSQTQMRKVFQLFGLLEEAHAPKNFLNGLETDFNKINFTCNPKFAIQKNKQVLKKFLDKYYSYPIKVINKGKQIIFTLS